MASARVPTRSSAEQRLAEMPGYTRLNSAGHMGELLLKTVRAAFRPPYTWRHDLVAECGIAVRRCMVPMVLSVSFFAIGQVVTIIAGLLSMLGTIDRNGAGQVVGWPRETAYWVSAMVFAGVVGSAMTADLGARKIRDELDAMTVLGVDSIKTMIVPRVLALTFIAPVLGMIALFNALFLMYALSPPLLANATYASFLDAMRLQINVPDLISFLARCGVTGLFVGIVSCSKGLTTRGGAEGVGRSVNEAVLISFLGIWIMNCVWNAAFLPSVPEVTVLRG